MATLASSLCQMAFMTFSWTQTSRPASRRASAMRSTFSLGAFREPMLVTPVPVCFTWPGSTGVAPKAVLPMMICSSGTTLAISS